MAPHPQNQRRNNPRFMSRDADGTVRLRIRFDGAEVALMEEAAGAMDVMDWIHMTLRERARADVAARRAARPAVPPPAEALEG